MRHARIGCLVSVALLLSTLALPLGASAQQPDPVKVQFGFILDGTNSMPPEDFQLMLEGLASQIGDPDVVPPDGSVEICVIQVGAPDPGARVELYPVIITGASQSETADRIRAIRQGFQWTATGSAIRLTYQTMRNSPNFTIVHKRVINVATDGRPYDKFKYPGSDTSSRSFQDVIDASAEAEAAGVDELDAEALGDLAQTPGQIESFRRWVFPQPAVIVPPEIMQPGFIRVVEDINDFADVMFEKLRALIDTPTPTPTPTSTFTVTPTFTLTPTPTSTPTMTLTGVATATPSLAPTNTTTPIFVSTVTPTPAPTPIPEIPEPSSLLLLATGASALLGLALARRRRGTG